MAEPHPQKAPRINPFWAYRDPLSGRWLTIMTSAQCQQLPTPKAFTPQVRTSQTPNPDPHTPPDLPKE